MTSTYQANLLTPDTEYNGWTNYQTWNAALWIGSDEGLYDIARRALDWSHLLEIFANYGIDTTGDGVDGTTHQSTHVKWTKCLRSYNSPLGIGQAG